MSKYCKRLEFSLWRYSGRNSRRGESKLFEMRTNPAIRCKYLLILGAQMEPKYCAKFFRHLGSLSNAVFKNKTNFVLQGLSQPRANKDSPLLRNQQRWRLNSFCNRYPRIGHIFQRVHMDKTFHGIRQKARTS